MKLVLIIFIFFSLHSQAHAAKRISSDELKLLVSDWLETKGILDADPKFKKGISFPFCSSNIHIRDMYGDMRTVEVKCLDDHGWKYIVRTGIKYRKIVTNRKIVKNERKSSQRIDSKNSREIDIVVLKRKLYEGQTITEEDLGIVKRKARKNDNIFVSIDSLVGRRMSRTLEANKVIREKDLARQWLIIQDQPVLIESSYKAIKVTSEGIAMENGMLGDLISIKNDSSGNIIKGWVQSKKKVSTNP